jgi:hypothetical protein
VPSEGDGRRAFVAHVLSWLGYPSSGPTRHMFRPELRSPETTLGREKISVGPAADYLFLADELPVWILDSRTVAGDMDDPVRHRQLYRFATHPEVAVKWYGICDDTEFALFDVDEVRPTPRLRVLLRDTGRRWSEIQRVLGPRGSVSCRPAEPADLGRHLFRLGLLRDRSFHLTNVSIRNPLIRLSTDGQRILLPLGIDFGDKRYVANLELNRAVLDDLLEPQPRFAPAALAETLAAAGPDRGVVVSFVGRASLEVRVGAVVSASPLSRVVPLRVERVLR